MPTAYQGLLGPFAVASAPVNGTDEVQTITPDAAPAAGTWRLSFEGAVTTALDFDATAAEMQAALRALPTIGADGVTVALDAGTGVYTVTFGGGNMQKLAHPLIVVAANSVVDAAQAAVTWTVAEGTPGVTATLRGARRGAVAINTATGIAYVNTSATALAPTWVRIGAGVQVAKIADAKVDYATPDLDTEAEVIVAINATNAKINAIIDALEAFGIAATA
jgi:hypothetical protein